MLALSAALGGCREQRHPPLDAVSLEPLAHRTSRAAAKLLAEGQIRGVALGLFSQDPRFDYAPLVDEIRSVGARWISLCVTHYQRSHDSSEIGLADPRTALPGSVRQTIHQAHRAGLRVMLMPIVLLQEQGDGHWRGTLAPSDRSRWFESYSRMLEAHARIAAETGVEMLSIGSELNSLEGHGPEWHALIGRLRSIYTGALIYSANWDSLDGPAFYDDLDFVGMTTYFSLGVSASADAAEIRASWRVLADDLALWMGQIGKPVVFTEVGYCSQPGAHLHPWNYRLSPEVDLETQRICYDVFTDTWRARPELAGVFFYNWFGVGGREDNGYTPRGKPALRVLERWFEPRAAPAAR